MPLFETEKRDVFEEPIVGASNNGLHLQLKWYLCLEGLVGEAIASYPNGEMIETWRIVLFGPQVAAKVVSIINFAKEKLGK